MGGADKPLLQLGGRTLLERVIERLAPQCPAGLCLSANGDPARFTGFPGPVLADGVPGLPGPLAGVLAGLDHAAAIGVGWVVSAPGDAPFLPGDLVARLCAARAAAGAALAHAASDGRGHYVVALWSTGLREDLRAALVERGERRVGAFLARHAAAVATWADAAPDPFLNVNAPGDLDAAAAALGMPDAAGTPPGPPG